MIDACHVFASVTYPPPPPHLLHYAPSFTGHPRCALGQAPPHVRCLLLETYLSWLAAVLGELTGADSRACTLPHHRYVDNLNKQVEGSDLAEKSLEEVSRGSVDDLECCSAQQCRCHANVKCRA